MSRWWVLGKVGKLVDVILELYGLGELYKISTSLPLLTGGKEVCVPLHSNRLHEDERRHTFF